MGSGCPRTAHRSLKCDCDALRSVSSMLRHLVMKSCGVIPAPVSRNRLKRAFRGRSMAGGGDRPCRPGVRVAGSTLPAPKPLRRRGFAPGRLERLASEADLAGADLSQRKHTAAVGVFEPRPSHGTQTAQQPLLSELEQGPVSDVTLQTPDTLVTVLPPQGHEPVPSVGDWQTETVFTGGPGGPGSPCGPCSPFGPWGPVNPILWPRTRMSPLLKTRNAPFPALIWSPPPELVNTPAAELVLLVSAQTPAPSPSDIPTSPLPVRVCPQTASP